MKAIRTVGAVAGLAMVVSLIAGCAPSLPDAKPTSPSAPTQTAPVTPEPAPTSKDTTPVKVELGDAEQQRVAEFAEQYWATLNSQESTNAFNTVEQLSAKWVNGNGFDVSGATEAQKQEVFNAIPTWNMLYFQPSSRDPLINALSYSGYLGGETNLIYTVTDQSQITLEDNKAHIPNSAITVTTAGGARVETPKSGDALIVVNHGGNLLVDVVATYRWNS